MAVLWIAPTPSAWAKFEFDKWDPRLLWATVALVAAILVGALIIAMVDRWRKRPVQERPTSDDQLAEFRSLYEQGVMSREEFDRVRAMLGERMRRELELPASPQAVNPPPENPPPPADPGGKTS
jgi:hypothetical protein